MAGKGRWLRALRRRGWIIVLQALLTAVAAYAFSAIQLPRYEAEAELFISASSTQILPRDLDQVRRDYAAYLYSGFRAQAVADALALDTSPARLLEQTTIEAGTDASTVVVQVESTHPQLAAAIARTWAQQLIAQRRLENADLPAAQRIEAELLDQVSVRRAGPRPLLNAVAGLFLGAAGGALLLLWLEWSAATVVRGGNDVEAALALPVLARIPRREENGIGHSRLFHGKGG